MKNQKIIIAIIIVIIVAFIIYFVASSKKSQRVLEPKESETGIDSSVTTGSTGVVSSSLFIKDVLMAKLYTPTQSYTITPYVITKVNSEGGKIAFTGGTWYSYFGLSTSAFGAISGKEPSGSYLVIAYELSDGTQKTETFNKGVPILIP